MIRVLVAYATKMGGTKGIADTIGDELTRDGIEAHVHDASAVKDIKAYDALVIGSAIYANRWRPEAIRLLSLADRGNPIPVWLFQSGPLGEGAETMQVEIPKKVARLVEALGAPVPMTFGGRIEPATAKGFIAKKMAKGPNAGDFRDDGRIRQWADGIAEELKSPKHADVWR
ncbi:MAG TPA: flavodoxin domain-containing protein [Nakamurella sp.]